MLARRIGAESGGPTRARSLRLDRTGPPPVQWRRGLVTAAVGGDAAESSMGKGFGEGSALPNLCGPRAASAELAEAQHRLRAVGLPRATRRARAQAASAPADVPRRARARGPVARPHRARAARTDLTTPEFSPAPVRSPRAGPGSRAARTESPKCRRASADEGRRSTCQRGRATAARGGSVRE